jgi:hypothetical protein
MAAPELKPVSIFDNYFLEQGTKRLFGLSENGLVDLKIESVNEEEQFSFLDFFKANNNIYITISKTENTGTVEEPVFENIQYYYEQIDNIISNVGSIPTKPIPIHGTVKTENFELIEDNYEGTPISKIFNLYFKGSVAFLKIDKCYESKDGLFFNVLESILPGKPAGLYFFPKDRTSCNKIKENGFFY